MHIKKKIYIRKQTKKSPVISDVCGLLRNAKEEYINLEAAVVF